MCTMDADELLGWMAFDTSNDEEFKKKIKADIAREEQIGQSRAEEARRVRELFMSLMNGNPNSRP